VIFPFYFSLGITELCGRQVLFSAKSLLSFPFFTTFRIDFLSTGFLFEEVVTLTYFESALISFPLISA